MHLLHAPHLEAVQVEQLWEIWNAEYPVVLAHAEVAALRTYVERLDQAQHLLLMDAHAGVYGWLAHFRRDGARWFVMLVDRRAQGQGLGSRLLGAAKEEVAELNGWVTDHDGLRRQDGQAYRSPLDFYRKQQFEVLSERRLPSSVLSAVQVRWVRPA